MATDKQVVKLNIGGTVFQTTKSTLTKFDGMFKVMMETEIPVIEDESGAIFIDRSPKHFDLILNYMRDGDVEIPDSEKEVKEIQKEAHYYLLDGLVELCKKCWEKPLENPKKLKIIESDAELLETMHNPARDTLVFHCPFNSFGAISAPFAFDIDEFLEKSKDKLDVYFKPYKCDTPVRGSEWQWTLYRKNGAVGSTPRDPRQSYGQHLEDELKYVLM